MNEMGIDNQDFSEAGNEQDLIPEKKRVCKHKYQAVEQIGKKHWQICLNRSCERRVLVR